MRASRLEANLIREGFKLAAGTGDFTGRDAGSSNAANLITYSSTIISHEKVSSWLQALVTLLAEMQAHQSEPNLITYNSTSTGRDAGSPIGAKLHHIQLHHNNCIHEGSNLAAGTGNTHIIRASLN